MAQAITFAGEKLFATQAQLNQALDIDTFIFANVPGQDPTAAIDRNEGLPPVAQRVHTQAVQQKGKINDNIVVYSTVLESITGPFEFNWVGLYSSVHQALIAVQHIPTVNKTTTVGGAAGNTLNRNFGIQYSGIAELTNITVDAQTWQLDFTARLQGIDTLHQQLAREMNGDNWFTGQNFQVVHHSGDTYKVNAGFGYVYGLRVELNNHVYLNKDSITENVYIDAWVEGDASSTWKPQQEIVMTDKSKSNYIDENGKQHYVIKIAVVNATDDIEDLRQASSSDVGVEDLRNELNNTKHDVSELKNDIDDLSISNLSGVLNKLDLHAEYLKFQGWVHGEGGGDSNRILTANANVGDNQISISGDIFVDNQLIVYQGNDGDYYTARIEKAGFICELKDPIEAQCDQGNFVARFYKNQSHPNLYGYRAIADYAIKDNIISIIKTDERGISYNQKGTASLSENIHNDSNNLGSLENPAIRVSCYKAGDGVFTGAIMQSAGSCDIEIMINTKGNTVRLQLFEVDTYAKTVIDMEVTTLGPEIIKLPFNRLSEESRVNIQITQKDNENIAFDFLVKNTSSSVEIIKKLNWGKHVFIGDSWFSMEGICERIQEKLPNADILNKGIGGSTSANIFNRIETDVTINKPDFVWVMCGTNDYMLGVSPSDFHLWINKIIARLRSLGVQVMIFTPSVGFALDNSLEKSRDLYHYNDYREKQSGSFFNETQTVSFSDVKVPANSKVFVACAGRTKSSYQVYEAFGNGVNNIEFGYSAGVSYPTEDVVLKNGNTIINRTEIDKSSTNERYICIGVENTTENELTANGFVTIKLKPSRR